MLRNKLLISTLIAILLFCFSVDGFAQSRFGVKGGMNFSGFRRTPETKFSYQAGVAGKKYIGSLGWFLQPEVFYSREGNLNQPLEFINVPIIVGFDFGDSFNVHTGLQAGFLVGTQGDLDNDYHNVNVVMNFGFEFYTFKKTSIGFRFDYGLYDFEKETGTSVTYTFEVYLIAWVIQ